MRRKLPDAFKTCGLLLLIGSFLIISAISCDRKKNNGLSLIMINVNNTPMQGDAFVIRAPGGDTVLIDTGFPEISKRQLIPYLKKNKIDKFDKVFISHAHRDHYGGIRPIIKAGIKIEEIFFNEPLKEVCGPEPRCYYDEVMKLLQDLKDKGVAVSAVKAGQTIDLGGGAIIRILYVFDGLDTPVGKTTVNDTSIIMMLMCQGYRVLFTGDLNRPIGAYLAKNAADIQADVLKVPHHGAEGLAPNSFFRKVNPKYALVPAPKHLWCSERSKRPRAWFKSRNIPVYVNGFSGNVTVNIKDQKLTIFEQVVTSDVCREK